jgi:hypothetical protein
VVALAGTSASFAGGPAALTVSVALAPIKPSAAALTVALPSLVGVRLATATPFTATTGDGGLKPPDMPATLKLMGLVASLTGVPLMS